jgi:hypothetical protein
MTTDGNMLPLHIVVGYDNEIGVVELILKAYPDAVTKPCEGEGERDDCGELALHMAVGARMTSPAHLCIHQKVQGASHDVVLAILSAYPEARLVKTAGHNQTPLEVAEAIGSTCPEVLTALRD